MALNLTDLVFRVSLITETLSGRDAVSRALLSSEFTSARLDEGRKFLLEAMQLMERVGERADDPTALEQARRAVTELELWHATTSRLWQKAAASASVAWDEVLGRDLEGADELLIVLMRAWRFISMARVSSALLETLERAGRRVADDMQRGYVLLLKAAKALQKHYHVNASEVRNGVRAGDVRLSRDRLDAWLRDFASAATLAFIATPIELGRLGVVPEGVGRPLGGAAYDVVLHERARGVVPEPIPAPPCSQWGVGAGGNRENYWEHQS